MQLSHYIDHTLLRADTTANQVRQLCDEARQFQFFSVCVNSSYVPLCVELLRGSKVKVCSVVGFPLGAMSTAAKAFETRAAVADGASEIDVVLNIGFLKDGRFDDVRNDLCAVVEAAQGKTVKVILETSLLSEGEKKRACLLSVEAKAHFVKTSTGFGGGGATLDDVKLMKAAVAGQAQIKASGGIKTREQAEALIAAGASRLGTSSGVALVQSKIAQGEY